MDEFESASILLSYSVPGLFSLAARVCLGKWKVLPTEIYAKNAQHICSLVFKEPVF